MSKQTIFLLDNQRNLSKITEENFITEDSLQEILATHPDLIDDALIDPTQPRKWILVSREMGIPGELDATNRWALDHLFIDQDGIPTLVEVKRAGDTRIRREVIGQILDYAANAVLHWNIEAIQTIFLKTCESRKKTPEEVLYEHISDEDKISNFWEQVETNLKAGKIRMLLIAEQIPLEMRRIIEFLNEQLDPAEILGLELRQYKNNYLQVLVPKVIGQTTRSTKEAKSKTEKLTEEEYFEYFKSYNKNFDLVKLKEILGSFKSMGFSFAFSTGFRGMASIYYNSPAGKEIRVMAIWNARNEDAENSTYTVIEFVLDMISKNIDDRRHDILEELRKKIFALPGCNPKPNRPLVKLDGLLSEPFSTKLNEIVLEIKEILNYETSTK